MVTMTRRTLYQTIRQRLQDAGIEDAGIESGFLLEFLLGKPLPQLLMDGELSVPEAVVTQAETLCQRRAAHYPLQYLFGSWEFYGLSFEIGEGVLIPRADTETLVDVVCTLRSGQPQTRLLDLCSGSGCIPAAIATQLPEVSGSAIERETAAFSYLQKNLQQYAPQIQPVQGDVLDSTLPASGTEYDVITCNPPYLTEVDMQQLQPEVAFEPETALYGGTDGLDFYRSITKNWYPALRKSGWLVYEIGKGQEQDVAAMLRQQGFSQILQQMDGNGIIRVVAGQK